MIQRDALTEYKETGSISSEAIHRLIQVDGARFELYQHYLSEPSIDFARTLLAELTALYQAYYEHGGEPMGTDELRLAGYLIGLHQDVSDSLLLWRTKQLSFDTACEFDIQLVVFAGVEPTISYLKEQPNKEAAQALEYIEVCKSGGDFEHLTAYFSPDNLPYWI
ncbi:hypothetical protein [Hymenobacter negativus]|uniref:Uncharacterized protein n=1 Tax=Hymenobacter negativus TaxID=2795026 RepID=A0ABS3Q9S8_9BACT|nr:hypothetical protein [Hymenobacter negativus]MBO2008000.1 hypothetical protein [Hymenobacter negativus]